MSGDGEAQVTSAVVVCDGATVSNDFKDRGWSRVPIRSHGAAGELNLHVDGLRTRYIGRLDERANDLVRIAAYAFAADQLISRGGKGDPNRRRWRRELALCVPVSDPSFWSDEDTTVALTEALGFGTEDRWEFAFSPAPGEGRHLQLAFDVDTSTLLGEPDCVALLSGGIDSFCATVETVAAHQRRPVLVSHRTTPPVATPQRRLLAGLEAQFPGWAFPHMSFWIHKRGKEAVERTRRTRGFLIAALGAAVAGQVELPTVLLPDNGYVSVNPPINAQLVGALNSRGTHPTFLRLVNRLLDLVFPIGVQLENPLQYHTRAEALALLIEHGCQYLLPETRSCAKSRQPAERPHCGVCSQCVDRRFATVAAGLEEFDPSDGYGVDVFTSPLVEGEPRVFATSYVGHAQRVDALSPEEMFYEFPELEACLDLNAGNVATSAGALADVLKRHGDEVLRAVGKMVSRYGEDIVRNRLPDTCLLQFAIDPTTRGHREDAASLQVPGIRAVTEDHLARTTDRQDLPRFERVGNGWWVTFGTEKGLIKHTEGMVRLARLLKAPGQELKALDLIAGSSPSTRSRVLGSVVGGPGGDALGASGDLGDIHDEDTTKHLKRRARELQVKLENAQASNDEDSCVAIRAELEEIADAMRSVTGKRGRRRKFANEDERARQSVSHTIRTALRAIERDMPALHRHFQESLQLGYSCLYDPKPRIRWAVKL